MLIEKLARKNILALTPYAAAREEYQDCGAAMTYLDANENPYDNGLNRYPDPKQKRLKTAFSQLKNTPEKNIILGNGSDELLDLLLRAFCEPNQDSVITLPPTYGMYGVLAQLNGVENREVILDADFEPDVQAILNTADARTKIIFLCSPNNPTANSFSEDRISAILHNFNGLVVIDEAYIDFSSRPSWLQKLAQFPNLLVLQTLSKAHGLAGIRLGILYANDQIISILDKIKPPYNINVLTQQVAVEHLLKVENTQLAIQKILANRALLQSELSTIHFIEKVYASDANFVLIKVDDAQKRYAQLIENGIVIRNRSNQPLCENCLRITVGTRAENKQLLQILKRI